MLSNECCWLLHPKEASRWGKRTLLDDDVVKPQLHLGTFNNTLFHCVLRYEPEHADLLHLTNPVSPVLRWQPITKQPQMGINLVQTTNGSPTRQLEETTRASSYHMAEHRPARSESLQPHTERSSRPGPEPSSEQADVYVWHYTLLVVHTRKERRHNSTPLMQPARHPVWIGSWVVVLCGL